MNRPTGPIAVVVRDRPVCLRLGIVVAGRIDRNLMSLNGRPCRPTRCWVKKTPRPPSSHVAIELSSSDRTEQHQTCQREHDVEGPLDDPLWTGQYRPVYPLHRDSPDMVGNPTLCMELPQPRHDPQVAGHDPL